MAHKPPQNHRQPTQLLRRISLSTARNRSPNLSSHSSHSWYSVSTHGFPQDTHSTVPSTGLQILAFCPQSSVWTGPCSISTFFYRRPTSAVSGMPPFILNPRNATWVTPLLPRLATSIFCMGHLTTGGYQWAPWAIPLLS